MKPKTNATLSPYGAIQSPSYLQKIFFVKSCTHRTGEIMKPTNLKEMLVLHEGLKLKPYKCSAGKLTIGVGRNIEDVGISLDEAYALLDNDLLRCELSARKFAWYAELDSVRQHVVLSMIFNVGLTRFKGFKKTIALIAAHDYAAAAKEMLNSQWARQVGKRANQLSELMRTGSYEETFKGES
jgi:lysozyme